MVNQRDLTDVLLWSIRKEFVDHGRAPVAKGAEPRQVGGGISRLADALVRDSVEHAVEVEQGTGGTTGGIVGDGGGPVNPGDLGDVADGVAEEHGEGASSNESGGQDPSGNAGETAPYQENAPVE